MNPLLPATYDLAYSLVLGGLVLVNVLVSLLVAMAAKRKDRAFGSFFWLSFAMGFLIPALVVAALPFREDDPDRPSNKSRL
ncbi:hypothetical protein CLV85_0613 [Salinibacterium amurskyense]|uniref:Uncharacterized protein n=1 Tax=Salinibacterium amurskyense TaxID=205941 RepID=A0A2M9D6V0_9MICO|nr:hypothetical protein [Salinibacterium amurskyense]PJJ81436.1 hypothetical protein CLV85_0613 [Salinibacterium amurskyense]RLQ83430.1 hypothetical protein D9C83_03020 [Salinibacterium amurskyense]GHD80500.1 hypothetical protein GCM10007394_12010 [Salinibacterium amurskyense]